MANRVFPITILAFPLLQPLDTLQPDSGMEKANRNIRRNIKVFIGNPPPYTVCYRIYLDVISYKMVPGYRKAEMNEQESGEMENKTAYTAALICHDITCRLNANSIHGYTAYFYLHHCFITLFSRFHDANGLPRKTCPHGTFSSVLKISL